MRLSAGRLHAVPAGMSTFSTRGGLYERAQKRFGVPDGKRLFTYAFFERQRLDAMVRAQAIGLGPGPVTAPNCC